ncbi:MAG TPA: PAS domain S-box protein [Pseudomonadales bacterium]|nr:PAS domain S-box protein [Pseudomonadales bacterium]
MNKTESCSGPSSKPAADGHSFQAMPIGVATSVNRIFTRVNSRLCEMMGYGSEELMGQSVRILFATDEEFERVGREVYADLEAHGAGAIETVFRHKNGTLLNVLLSSNQTGKEKNSTEVTFNIIDITKPRRIEQELSWQNRELAALHRVSEIMLSGQPEQEIFDTIAGEIAGITDFPMVSIELCDFERAVMVYRGTCGIPLEDMPTPFEVPMDVTLSGEVAHTGSILIETETFNRREYAAPILRRLGVQTFVCIPIKTRNKIIGTLSLAHDKKIQIEPAVMVSATSLANYLATLIDRLQARHALHRGEVELAAVYDRAPSAMCLFDERLDIVRANRAAAEFVGCDQAELNSERFFRALQNQKILDDNPAIQNMRGVLADTLVSGKSRHRVRMEQGHTSSHPAEQATVHLLSTERIQTDSANRVLMCLEDITPSVRADEQIRSQAALLDISGDAIYVRNFSNRIIYWNEGAHRLYGWASADACGKTILELDVTVDPKESALALKAVQEHEKWAGEMRQKSRDGREWIVQSRWTLMRERDGKPKAILVVNTDITEKKKLEAQLLRSQRMESIGTLASGLAHDLNNVLAPIMMALEFLRDGVQDESMKTYVQTLEMCSLRGASIIRQVLMFARGVEGERVLINPKHLIVEMERIARETFSRSIEIRTVVPKEACILLGDATQIQQVLMNLCVNGRDAMPRGGTLTIRLEKVHLDENGARIHIQAKPGNYVVISVSDTGTGIPPELIDKIFDPFFTTKPVGQGTGLGLATTLGIAEKHGGFIQVESEADEGTTFKVYFPAAPSEHEVSTRERDRGALSQGNNELILVVDDEPAIRRLAETVLARNGYRTLLATNGREGFSLYQQHRSEIKLIVSDLMMPHMDGPTLIRELRLRYSDVKAIIITGLGEENRMGDARAAGVDAILNKPFTADQLLTSIKQLI